MEEFKTIKENCFAQIVEKKSKFIDNAFYIESKDEAEDIINSINKKYFDARHNCYAYIVNDNQNIIQKCSDDGEPAKTAGTPILNIIKTKGLCNVLIIVTRYFGGVLLGTGGLIRAYSEASVQALNKTSFIIKQLGQKMKLKVEYSNVEQVKYYCRKKGIMIVEEEYSNDVNIFIEISNKMMLEMYEDFESQKLKATKIEKIEEKYIEKDN